MKENELK